MLVDIPQTIQIGQIIRGSSPALKFQEITCCKILPKNTTLYNTKKYAIENLCNLDKISSNNFTVYNLPSKIKELDAQPTRILLDY